MVCPPPGPFTGERLSARAEDAATAAALRRRLWFERAFSLFALALLAALLYRFHNPPGRWAIIVDNRPVAIVTSRAVAERVLGSVLRSKAGASARHAHFRQTVAIEQAGPADGAAVDRWQAQQRVGRVLDAVLPVCWIVVDGVKRVALATRADAEGAVSDFVRHFVPQGALLLGKPRLREQVGLLTEQLPVQRAQQLVVTRRQAVERLLRPSLRPTCYTVRPGDTATRIASRFRVTLADLRAANPGAELDRLIAGREITVAGGLPPITVEFRVTQATSREIPFWLEFVPDRSLPTGERRLLQTGKPGAQAVTSTIAYVNDREVSRSERIGAVLNAPTPERFAVGSRGDADDDRITAARSLDDLTRTSPRRRRPTPASVERVPGHDS